MQAAARSGGEPRGARLGFGEPGGRIASAAWQRPVSSRAGRAGVVTMLGCLAEIAEGVVVEGVGDDRSRGQDQDGQQDTAVMMPQGAWTLRWAIAGTSTMRNVPHGSGER